MRRLLQLLLLLLRLQCRYMGSGSGFSVVQFRFSVMQDLAAWGTGTPLSFAFQACHAEQ
jgi:hypothetical protein